MSDLSSVTGASSAIDYTTPQTTTKSSGSELGKDSFLKLLVTQLQHQDPLNPMEDKDFTAQLAQFSSLEQLQKISTSIDNLAANSNRQDMLSGVSFMGKKVLAEGYTISKENSSATPVYYTLTNPVAAMSMNVYDANGVLVQTVKLGAREAGSYQFDWDGKDYTGKSVANGTYSVAVKAENAAGKSVLVTTEVSGTVSGVSTDNGVTMFRLSDGRKVSIANVKEVVGS